MGTMELHSTYAEDWVKKFNPQKRIMTGYAYYIAKRILDVSIVLLASPFWVTIMLLVSLAVVVTSSTPVFFVQLRTGKGGKRFRMYKFRSMVKNAEQLKKDLAKVNANGDLAGPLKLKNDPRVTALGRILRKTSLD